MVAAAQSMQVIHPAAEVGEDAVIRHLAVVAAADAAIRPAVAVVVADRSLVPYVVLGFWDTHQPLIKPADDVLQAFDAMPGLT